MLHTFLTSFRLKNTYRVNSIIYSIKGLPIVNKILPSRLYQVHALKILANILSGIWEIIHTFLGKFLYLLLMIFFMLPAYQTDPANTFLHIFTFLTIAGALLNTYMFNPTKDKYYALILMNMDAKEYTISNYIYAMVKVVVGFLPFTIGFGYFNVAMKLPLWVSIVMPLFVVMMKTIFVFYYIKRYEKTKIAVNENLPTKASWFFLIICVALAYGLPWVGFVITPLFFLILFVLSLLVGIYSLYKVITFQDYKKLYRSLLTTTNVYAVQNANSTETIRKNIAKNIEYQENISSDKHGFAYFHDLFVKRHSKLLTKAAKKQSLAMIAIFIIIIMMCYAMPPLKEQLNNVTLTYLPYFVFIMYLLNRGTTITQAFFMNCDHSMLTYRIYRTPKVILGMFTERLKTLISINLLPSSILGLGLALLLYVTGGTDNVFKYFILFISINAMSVFFSVHYLVMYYLLQPYNVNTELKSSTYKVVQTLTYLICYFMIQIHLPTFYFGLSTIVFSVIYCIVSLIFVYRLAPKTFKIRI